MSSNTSKPRHSPSASLNRLILHRHRPATAPSMSSVPLFAKSSLHSKERADLVRRTRKLEQLLGVSMQVVVDDSQFESGPTSPDAAFAQPQRRRLRSMRRPSAPALIIPATPSAQVLPTNGVLVQTSTQVYVDPSSSGASASPTTPTAFATAFPSSPSSIKHNLQQPNLIRSKSTTRSFASHPSSQTDTPVLHVGAPASRSGRPRSESVTTFDSVDSRLPEGTSADSSDVIAVAARQRQIHMAHKLQRHLGEAIPSELVVRQKLPPSRSSSLPSPTTVAEQESSKRRKIAHKPSLSLRMISRKKSRPTVLPSPEHSPAPRQRTTSHKKVASDDISITSGTRMLKAQRSISPETQKADWASTLTTLPLEWSKSVDDGVNVDVALRPVQSASGSDESAPAVKITVDEPVSRPSVAMTQREKMLNVRRAIKMSNKFGEAPPLALFQITNTAGIDSRSTSSIEVDISVIDSASLMAPRSPAASSTWSFHASQNSENEAPGSVVSRMERASITSSLVGRGRGSSVSSIAVSIRSVAVPSETRSDERKASSIELPIRAPQSPALPTPTSRRSMSVAFASRRKQATKLTRFFGVDYPDLYQAMVVNEGEAAGSSNARPILADLDLGDPDLLRVDDHDACRWSVKAPEEVKEVMNRLRELKA